LHDVHGGAHGKMLLGWLGGEAPIKCSRILTASTLGRCLGLNTKRAAARMTISLMANATVISGTSGCCGMRGILLRCGKR
jgi:hypothetical protein